ncbi:MAG: CDP-diacylglycerol--glycerol-3-phosphate 3-phosphatidyltransferase [Planctomycetes bacterium]|nr:CDP-diacylglycerol--glycerol-3-phosphate 3-phosphatidyltransferase [Planctomycetota bacterium]
MTLPRNLPNLITGSRLVLAVALFVILGGIDAALRHADVADPLHRVVKGFGAHDRLLLNVCLAIFVTAAISDILDGHIARRWGLQTDFGRIVDPFADKVIVCGAFVQLVPFREAQIASWMVVVILARELLVDGLRGFAESRGVAFPAMASGKLKMTLQSACISWILFALANLSGEPWARWVTLTLVWSALAVTVFSGLQYVFHARRVLSSEALATLTSPGDPSRPGAT